MKTVGLLMLMMMMMMIGVTHGVEFYCDGRQDGSQCYGALGEAVVLQLMDNTSGIPIFSWKKSHAILLQWRQNRLVANTMGNRTLFNHIDGTTRIHNLNMGDSGVYELQTFDTNGRQTRKRTLQLSVQTPVSSVKLVSECLSQGEMKVSCSSETGDSPQYSWTLDGHTLTDSELLFRNNETNAIVLRQNISGHLNCSVRNQVSGSSKQTHLSTCGFIFINCTSNGTQIMKWVFNENNTLCVEASKVSAVEQWSIGAGVPSMLLLFFILFIAITFNRRKKIYRAVQENDQETTYSDINIVQQEERQEEQSVREEDSDMEVKYGQIKISEPPCQPKPAVEDLYAKICKVR